MKMTYKVIISLGVIGLGFWLGFRMGDSQGTAEIKPDHQHQEAEQTAVWTCPMHPQIRQDSSGLCPICGMDLVRVAGQQDDLGPWELKMSESAIRLAELETYKVKKEYVTRELRLVGKVEYDEKRVGVISAWAAGRVDHMYVDFTGVMINKNDHLVDIYSPKLLSTQSELLSASASFRNAQSSGTNSKSALKRVMAAREKLRLYGLTLEQAAEIESRGTPSDQLTIYSHLSGYVLEKHIVLGQYVKQGEPLYTVADLSRVWVKLEAYEDDLTWLSYGQEVEFDTHAWPGKVFKGRIVYIDPIIDAATRTVKVRLNMDNAEGLLKPDMFVSASIFARVGANGKVVHRGLAGKWISPMHPEIVRDGPGKCDVCGMDLVRAESLGLVEESPDKAPLIIPASAPLITGERAVVYLKDPDRAGVYMGREIILGPRAGDNYVVRSGLEEGDEVVTNGNFKIDSELQINAKYSMMYHNAPAKATQAEMVQFQPPQGFLNSLTPLWSNYFKLQQALSLDQLVEARSAADSLQKVLDNLAVHQLEPRAAQAWNELSKNLKKQARLLNSSGGLDQARVLFEKISLDMARVGLSFGVGNQDVFKFHCPMAFDRGADWFQDNKSLANPYFGSKMFRCGEQVDVLKSSGQASKPAPEQDHRHDQKPAEKKAEKKVEPPTMAPAAFQASIRPCGRPISPCRRH